MSEIPGESDVHAPGTPEPDAAPAADLSAETGAGTEPEEAPRPVRPAHRELTVGFVPGVMPAKWFDRWRARFGARVPLRTLPLEPDSGLAALAEDHAHMVLVRPEREPEARDRSRYHAVRLYEEVPVVVMPADHVLSLLDEVPVEEIAEDFLLQDPQEVPEWAEASAEHRAANPQKLPAMRHLGDAVELVAAGLGLLVLPQSLARFHRRKDVVHRPLTGVAGTEVLLVWPRLIPGERPEEDEAILQEFVGITRGRRPDSSRGTGGESPAREGRGGSAGGKARDGRAAGTKISGTAKASGTKKTAGVGKNPKGGSARAASKGRASGRRGTGRPGSRGGR